MSRALASIHLQAMGERDEGEEPLLLHKTVTGWATKQEVLRYDIDMESMTIALPARKVTRFTRASGTVATETRNGIGGTSTCTGREVASRIVCNPARTILHPSASAVI